MAGDAQALEVVDSVGSAGAARDDVVHLRGDLDASILGVMTEGIGAERLACQHVAPQLAPLASVGIGGCVGAGRSVDLQRSASCAVGGWSFRHTRWNKHSTCPRAMYPAAGQIGRASGRE